MKRRVGIADIAAAAGVSVGTVSNVLNSPERVRPVTRERVYAAMRALGYLPAALTFPAEPAPSPVVPAPNGGAVPLLVSVGYISVDLIARLQVMPHRGDRATAARISKTLGGPAANVAVAAAALGAPCPLEIELATAIGKDTDSLWALERLAERGVRARAVRSPFNERLSRCIVLLEAGGERTKINEPFPLDSSDLVDSLSVGPMRRPCHLHFEGYHAAAMLPLVDRLRAQGWALSTQDTGLDDVFQTRAGFAELVARLDRVFLSRRAAARILGRALPSGRLVEAMAAWLDSLPDRRAECLLTLGMDGAAVFPALAPAHPLRVPAPTVEVVDGTGAGDAWVGAYLGQRLHDIDAAEAAELACICASRVMTGLGAQEVRTPFQVARQLQRETA
ncbi:MAG: PfkB family carbohydrate kinase [Roseinatronobacter sp.]